MAKPPPLGGWVGQNIFKIILCVKAAEVKKSGIRKTVSALTLEDYYLCPNKGQQDDVS